MYYLEAGNDKQYRLRNAVLLAMAVHAALILGISFDATNSAHYTPQLEVTLASRPGTAEPEDASHMAQANQEGGGDQAEIEEVTSRNNHPPTEARAAQQASTRAVLQKDIVTTTAAARRAASIDQAERRQQQTQLPGIDPEVGRLSQQLASLEAELDEQTRTYANTPRVRRLTSVSAKASADAAYLLDWRRRLEAVGNKYYPEASVRYGIYGDVRLLVIIRNDGSLEDIRVLSSSGYAVLDEASIKIVSMAAPFSPFPPELRATTDKLEIIRTWQYRENRLSSQQR
ncbi:MAG: energy transducer TonB [Gammaproteobacteria bacterium]|nr:MAG: energy transducer TonB [Gammaproteobacteria bacterium]RLA59761.1 MAG: energy transducer TonB [Gammaproteobacteria bacterium]